MGLEYDYYGNYSKIQNPTNQSKTSKDYKLRLTAIICLFVPCVIILGINTYLLYVTQVDYKYLLEDYDELYKITRNMRDDIQKELKPRLDFVTHFLSYKLPNAVLHSFKRSNQELTDQLGGITFNLNQLLELYRSILGFDDDWQLTPDTQHMTCSFIPPDQVSPMYERAFAARERYAIKVKHPPDINPIIDRKDYDSGALSAKNLRDLIKAANMTGSGLTKDQRNYQSLVKTLLEYLGINKNSTGFAKAIHNLAADEDSENHEREQQLDTELTSEAGPTVAREKLLLTPTPKTSLTTSGSPSKSRKRRYAAHMGYAINRSGPVKDFLKGVKVKIHTITGTVRDMCAATKNILGIKNNTCLSNNRIVELLKCLTQ